MTGLARVGGALLIAGVAVAGLWAAVFNVGVGAGGSGAEKPLVTGFLALLSAGAGAVSATGATPLERRSTRIGLALAAIGLLGVAIGTSVVVIPAGSNELSSRPFIISTFGGGLLAAIGWLVLGLSLARSSGRSRIVGLVLLGSVLTLPLSVAISLPFHIDASVVVLGGAVIFLLGVVGVGLLALGLGKTKGA